MAKKKKNKLKVFIWLGATLVIAALCYGVFVFVKASSYFDVRAIVFNGEPISILEQKLKHIRGKNIFLIDLSSLSEGIQSSVPDVHRIRLLRQFPDTVLVDYVKRIPVARVILGGDAFLIDEDMVVLPLPPEQEDDATLMRIRGLDARYSVLKPGKPLQDKSLAAALSLLKVIQQTAELKEFEPHTMSVADKNMISFYVRNDVEIRVGWDGQEEKLRILALLLRQSGMQLDTIRYIDLRFKEPIIKRR